MNESSIPLPLNKRPLPLSVAEKEKSLEHSFNSSKRRSPSSFLLFCADNRKKLKESNPDVTFAELSKILAQKWGELSSEEKSIYVNKAKELNEHFKTENNSIPFKDSRKNRKYHNVQFHFAKIDSFPSVNSLFQSSPFIFQQLLYQKGYPNKELTVNDIYNIPNSHTS